VDPLGALGPKRKNFPTVSFVGPDKTGEVGRERRVGLKDSEGMERYMKEPHPKKHETVIWHRK
jgi:hypothetical protein